MTEEQAVKIVNAVFGELGGRGGIGDTLSMIQDDSCVYKDMHESCVEKVMSAYNGECDEFDDHWSLNDTEASK